MTGKARGKEEEEGYRLEEHFQTNAFVSVTQHFLNSTHFTRFVFNLIGNMFAYFI